MADRVYFEDGSSVPSNEIAFGPKGWYRTGGGPFKGGQGGYRRPSNPAPVSGPAQLSQRTDGGPGQPIRDLKDAKYGEEQAYIAQQQGAPMAQAPGMPSPAVSPMEAAAGPMEEPSPLTGFGAPTERAGEPITSGVPLGPGMGDLNAPQIGPGQLSRALEPFFAEDETGVIRLLAEDLAEWGL
jgi:hypothetical protein